MDHAWRKWMWTVQEIVLARSAKLTCGGKSASWGYLGESTAFALEVPRFNTRLRFGRPIDEAVFDETTAGDDAGRNVPRLFEDDTVLEIEGVSVDQVEKLGDACPSFAAG
ncbi:hypothetical protein B0T26DRAFT_757201 [Lasiosphaeria miniovina]|uniref:Heterokaryon incompatibility domain-containing protein n=1 Tax=Lasiosphaeria miniovina TaxID=1954250 RepID=A0AA39ZTZ4_9PEZI|nr:uncharacterized protein B0T26DRAFT_757201 [Lasiosphaeria miniovina]KAK0703681.1 hypothetical protein B0T26DRAFT_757201 [Lasiosphaeria miniovina]